MSSMSDHSHIVLRRMIDANGNRVMEGLRTLEDVARFSGVANLQAQYKPLRHSLQRILEAMGQASLLTARDADGDVGRQSKTGSEMERSQGVASIVGAASARVEQGLRVIEESCKVLMPSLSREVEVLRYRVYDLNSSLQLVCHRDIAFLRQSKLYVLVDCQVPIESFRVRLKELSDAGVQLIQIRDKGADAIRLVEYLQVACGELDGKRTRVLMNDRVDIAATTQVYGVHVGQEDLSVGASRRLLHPWQVLGLSTHDLDQVRGAIDRGVDYLGCGPTFPSKTKTFEQFSGLEFLKTASEWIRDSGLETPAFAIGGIEVGNLPQVIEAGFRRIAVSSCVWNARNPGAQAEKLRALLDRA